MISNIGYVILGILIFIIPGFLLSFLLFEEQKKPDHWKRIGMSIGLSSLVILLITIILATQTISKLELIPFITSITIFCISCAILTIFRKKSRKSAKKFFDI